MKTILSILIATMLLGSPALADTNSDSMLDLTNQARTSRSIAALTVNDRVARYAYNHSITMAQGGTLVHTNNLGKKLTRWGIKWTTAGENIGRTTGTLAYLQQAFMDSPGHRANILNPQFKNVGIGVYVDSKGEYWVTLDRKSVV